MIYNTIIVEREDVTLEVNFEYDPLDLVTNSSFFAFNSDINIHSINHKKECILHLMDATIVEDIERELFNTIIKHDTTYIEY
jgi:hypothetical protein